MIGSLVLWRRRKGADTRIPFGPYLALGGIVALLWGPRGGHRVGGPLPGVIAIGLTGGIGSGKSTVAADLERARRERRRHRRDLARAHRGRAARRSRRCAPSSARATSRADGALDRAAMRELVFEDPLARARLEAILHPAIREATDAALARSAGVYALVAVPLLFETRGYIDRVARTLVVDCPEELQVARTAARSGLDAEPACARSCARSGRAGAACRPPTTSSGTAATRPRSTPQCARLHADLRAQCRRIAGLICQRGDIAPQSGAT